MSDFNMKHIFWVFFFVNFLLEAQTNKSVVIGTMASRPNAVLILNPPDANQGFLVPQLSTVQRLAMHPSSPLENGLMVFDASDKSFYHWKDDQWVKGLGDNAIMQDLVLTGKVLNLTNDPTPVDLSSLSWTGANITDGSIATADLANTSVTTAKLSPGPLNTVLTTNGTGSIVWTPKSSLDAQDLSISGNILSLANDGTTVDLSNLVVDDIQGNPVSPGVLGAPDTGKILVWNGAQWVPQLVNSVSPLSQYYMIDPADFTNLRRDDTKDKDNIIMFQDNSTYVTTIKKNEGPEIIAPVHLPEGAKVEQITLYYMDRDPQNIDFNFYRKSPTGSNQTVIPGWSSTGNSGAIQSSTHTPIVGNEIIDNNNYSYRLVISLDQSIDVDDSSGANLRLYAVKIKFLP